MQTIVQLLARGLADKGFNTRTTIGICAENRVEWVAADLLCLLYSMIFVPIQTSLSTEDIYFILKESRVQVLFVSNATAKSVLEAIAMFSGQAPLLVFLDVPNTKPLTDFVLFSDFVQVPLAYYFVLTAFQERSFCCSHNRNCT